MLKIYLDWNCINNIQTKYPKLYELIKEYGHLFIFPYSNAHIRDLIVSHKPDNSYFESDIETLCEICGKHHLLFENNIMQPLFGFPKEYVKTYGDALEIVQKSELITPEQYQLIKQSVREGIPKDVYQRIQGAKSKEVFNIINGYFCSIQPDLTIQKITIEGVNLFRQYLNDEAKFKSLCLALDVIGFRPENKNKAFTNIDTDASHIFYAAHCDFLVSEDTKMRDKAEAMYEEYHIQTHVKTPKQLEDFILNEIDNEYSLTKLLECIEKYGHPRDEEDGLHYKLMDSPIWGLFNACMLIDEHFGGFENPNSALFVYSFDRTPFLYYTELERFFDLVKNILPEKKHEVFQKGYVDKICSGNIREAVEARYSFDVPDLNLSFAFYSDPIAPVPCPMMQVRFK